MPSTAPKPASGASVPSSRKFACRRTSAIAEPGEPLPDPRDRAGIGVEPEDAAVRAGGLQDPLGVPTAADGAIDMEAAGARGEHLHDLLREHRSVPFFHVLSTIDVRIPSGPWKRM